MIYELNYIKTKKYNIHLTVITDNYRRFITLLLKIHIC